MPKCPPWPSFGDIVTTFDSWLKHNHDELFKDTPLHILSVIENKWDLLIKEYTDALFEKYTIELDNIKSHTYPEEEE